MSGGSVVEESKAEKGQNGCGEGPGCLCDKMPSEQRPEVQQEGSHTVLGTASSTETEVGVSEGGSGWITWGLSMRKKCNTSSKRVGGGPSAEPPWVWKSR